MSAEIQSEPKVCVHVTEGGYKQEWKSQSMYSTYHENKCWICPSQTYDRRHVCCLICFVHGTSPFMAQSGTFHMCAGTFSLLSIKGFEKVSYCYGI